MTENVMVLSQMDMVKSKTKKERLATEAFLGELQAIKKELYNFIIKNMQFSEDANDVFQDSILRAFKYLKSFKSRGQNLRADFRKWLFAIACNQIKYHYKKKLLLTPAPVEAAMENQKTPAKDLEKIYEVAMELNTNQRQVFFLFYYSLFSIEEISTITGLKKGNIKFILFQAREKIKTILGVKDEKENR